MRVRIGDAEIEVTGPPSFVDARIAEFMKQATATAQRGQSALEAGKGEDVIGDNVIGDKKGLAPGQFFKKLNSKSDVNAVLAAGYYMEKVKAQENFTALEIRDLLGQAKRQPPKNINDAINGNIKKGLIMSAGDRDSRMAFVLTTDGEDAVQNMAKLGG